MHLVKLIWTYNKTVNLESQTQMVKVKLVKDSKAGYKEDQNMAYA